MQSGGAPGPAAKGRREAAPADDRGLGGLLDHVVSLRRYARALVGDRGEGDDLVQETLARALSRAHLFRPGSNLRAWLFTIMHNVHINRRAHSSSRASLVPLEDFDPRLTQSAGQEDHVEIRQLAAILRSLPDEQREVLLLVSMEGLKYQEVASVLDIPIGTVMSRLSRARATIRRRIGPEG